MSTNALPPIFNQYGTTGGNSTISWPNTTTFTFSATATPPKVETVEIPLSFRQTVEVPQTDGSMVVQGVRIFKVGAFKDSLGRATKWSSAQLDQMILNFEALKDIFPHVPVRKDHSKTVDAVVGYLKKLYRDAEGFLVADLEFTDPTGYEKWQNKTFRGRSLEVGAYETNDGQKFYPTVMGLAFVDIPAVEGLHNKEENEPALFNKFLVVDGNKENTPMDPMSLWLNSNPGKTAEDWVKAVNYAAWLDAANYAKWEQDATYAQAVQVAQEQASALGLSAGNPPPTPAPSFNMNTEQAVQFQQMQQEVAWLRQFRTETISGGRAEFVKGLAASGKLAQTQVESETKFAQGLTDEQWDHYKTSREAAPAIGLFGQYGATDTQNPDPVTGAPSTPAGMMGFQVAGMPDLTPDTALEIVENHKRSGKSAEFIKDSLSYKFLAARNQAPSV